MAIAAPNEQDPNRRFYEDADTTRYYAGHEGLTPPERTLFTHHLRSGMDILDLGVGCGRTTPYLSGIAGTYVGVDYAAPMVDVCRTRFPGLAFHHADAADLSFLEDGSFDAVVFSFNGIDYLSPAEQRRRCLAECRRVLRSGGVLIFSRHNPRAVIRLPDPAGKTSRQRLALRLKTPVWAARRAARLLPHRAFWTGEGPVAESPAGFTTPLLAGRRRRRDPRGDLLTHMAVPGAVARELKAAGFTALEIVGGVDLDRTAILSTPYFYYVAIRG